MDVDSNKRLAIRDVFFHRVWSITWKDVQDRLTTNAPVFDSRALDASGMAGAKDFERTLQRMHEPDWKIKNLSSFDLLLRYLGDPQAEVHFEHFASALSVGMLDFL